MELKEAKTEAEQLKKLTRKEAENTWKGLESTFLPCASKIRDDETFISGLCGKKDLSERSHYLRYLIQWMHLQSSQTSCFHQDSPGFHGAVLAKI